MRTPGLDALFPTAIEVLHSRGIVHRDIGPRNIILVDPEYEERAQQGSSRVRRGVLIDFDLAAKAETLRTTRLPSVSESENVYRSD